jgi:hypothetical protein
VLFRSASARVKEVEAKIAAETARGMKELADMTMYSADSANVASDGYRALAQELGGVKDAADQASESLSILDDKSVTSRQAPIDIMNAMYRAGASVEEAKAAQKYYGELYDRNAATMLTGNLGNMYEAARMQNNAIDSAVEESLKLARKELATGQAVDLGTSVKDLIARELAISPANMQSAAIQRAGNAAKAQTSTVNINLGGKKTAINVASSADADALTSLFRRLEADAARS